MDYSNYLNSIGSEERETQVIYKMESYYKGSGRWDRKLHERHSECGPSAPKKVM